MRNNRESRAHQRGIFVQQVNDGGKIRGYCVTFPRIANITGDEADNRHAVYPTVTVRRFSEALTMARTVRHVFSPFLASPIYCLQFSWRKGYCGTRILQEVER